MIGRNQLLMILGFLLGLSCEPAEKTHIVHPTFYHWQSDWQLAPAELLRSRQLSLQQLYLRYFDLDWNATKREVIPLAPLQIVQPAPADWTIIPTIFITNRSLKHSEDVDLKLLSQRMAEKIRTMHRELGQSEIKQIQLDCDWTQSTRAAYFELLNLMKAAFPRSIISATIRLHQIKYPKQTGIPPVDRGMLMFYNMGDLDEPMTDNSIFDWQTALAYLQALPDYPLALDLALPLFSWGVVFRDGKMLRLLNNLRQEEVTDRSRFEPRDSNWVELVKSTYLQGHYLYQGDRIRLESVKAADLVLAAAYLRQQIANDSLSLAFYHLDTTILKHYPDVDLKKIIDALATP